MAQRIEPTAGTAGAANVRTQEEARREDWLRGGILSGFIATFAMSVTLAIAYGLTSAIGDPAGGSLARWSWALGNNPVTDRTRDGVLLAVGLNLLMGLVWALVYGRLAEPMLGGPGWRKGMLFALVPWLLSIGAFLPVMGGGFLGTGIDAGPLPVVGNLVLHLVYGAILGAVYGIALDAGLDDTDAERANAAAAERGIAIGIVGGVLLGLAAGWLLGPQLDGGGSRGAIALGGALIGGASGIVAGSFLGMGRPAQG